MGLFSKRPSRAELQSQLNELTKIVSQKIPGMTLFPTYLSSENAERFCTTDDIYSIVKFISTAVAGIPLYASIQKGKEIEEVEDTDPVQMLLNNPFQGKSTYESLYILSTTLLVQGECFAWKERPGLGPNKGKITSLHYMEPQSVNIVVSDSWPRKIISYQYAPNGVIVMDNIPAEEMIHWKYFNPKVSFNGDELRGLSPLKVLAKRLTRVDSNMDVSTAQLQNGGVPGIVYDKSMPHPVANTVDNVSLRKTGFYKYLANSANKGAPYFSAGEMGYIELGLKLADMQVADLAMIDFKKMCNVFGVSARLFNNDGTGSENSDKGARIGFYTNAVIPVVKIIRDGFAIGLKDDFKSVKYIINYDTDDVAELQQDQKYLVEWLEKAWWLTPNEKREAMKYDLSSEPMFDKYILPQSLQTVDDLAMLPPIDNNV